MSHIYFLRPGGKNSATKTYQYKADGTIERTSSYGAGKFFMARRVPKDPSEEIKNAKTLHKVVKKAGELGNFFVVRGTLRSGKNVAGRVNRRYKSTSKNPAWKPCNQRWAMLDIDGMDLPGFLDPVDVAGQREVVQYVKTLLPDWLSDAGCTYHWSSSAGLTKTGDNIYEEGWDKISLHLWFWFDRPVSGFSLRKYVKKVREDTGVPIDASPFNPVQPHYTANPVFKGGEDVIEERTGYMAGEDIVARVPAEIIDLDAWTKKQEKRKERRKKRIAALKANPDARRSRSSEQAYVDAAVNNSIDRIKNAGKGQRHFAIFSAAAGLGELAAYIDNAELIKERLINVGEAVLPPSRHAEVHRTVEDGWADGSKTPKTIAPVQRGGGFSGQDGKSWKESGGVLSSKRKAKPSKKSWKNGGGLGGGGVESKSSGSGWKNGGGL